MTRAKILHVLPWISTGGVEKRRFQIIRGLDPERFEHRVVCKAAAEVWTPHIEATGAQITELGGSWQVHDLDTIAALLNIIEDYKPDIIHGAVFEGVVMGAMAGYLGRVPWVLIEETGATPHRRIGGDFLMGAMAALSHRCVAVSPFTADYLRERSHIAPDKLHVIHNGVMFPAALSAREREAGREAWGFSDADVVVGTVGRVFNQHKRFTDLIDALVLCDDTRMKLLIVGDGPDLPMLRAHAARAGVAHRVVFAGRQTQMEQMYGLMDVFALASAYESFGLVLVEAMSVGLPLVATEVGGISGIVQHEQTGFLVPPQQPEMFALHLRKLLTDPSLRLRMGRAGRARAMAQFSEARYLNDVRALYDSLLRALRASPAQPLPRLVARATLGKIKN